MMLQMGINSQVAQFRHIAKLRSYLITTSTKSTYRSSSLTTSSLLPTSSTSPFASATTTPCDSHRGISHGHYLESTVAALSGIVVVYANTTLSCRAHLSLAPSRLDGFHPLWKPILFPLHRC
ncbi:signal peptidase I [Sesbania bispinosa]|nr:signal peptidase I [Sesbania bispinosa]